MFQICHQSEPIGGQLWHLWLCLTGSWSGMVALAPKWVRLVPNGKIRGFSRSEFSGGKPFGKISVGKWAFSDQISVHLAPRAKCTEIWSEKAPDLSHLGPIWPTDPLWNQTYHPCMMNWYNQFVDFTITLNSVHARGFFNAQLKLHI